MRFRCILITLHHPKTMYLTHKGEQISMKQIREFGEIKGTQLIFKADKYTASMERQIDDILEQNPDISENDLALIEEQKQKLKQYKDEIIAEGYKDLHTVVMEFFSKNNKSNTGVPLGLLGMLFYVFSMAVLGFHLWHGFASAFQSLGLNHPKYSPMISMIGKGFAVVIPLLFAIIPALIYLNS